MHNLENTNGLHFIFHLLLPLLKQVCANALQ